MTGLKFLEDHGDPATWTDDAYELYAQCATPGAPVPDEVLAFIEQPPPARAITAAPQPAA